MANKIALITGATSGIGKACAELLSKNNFDLIVTGRREERLNSLKKDIENENCAVNCLCFDIRKREEVENAIHSLSERWQNIHVLINNAGLAAGLDYFEEADTSDWDQMIDTNIKGLLYISKSLIPHLKQSKNGHIVNIGSIAGKETYEKGHVYCSTKHAVEAITKGMRIDLLRHNIKVSSICPGMVETEFSIVRFKGDKEKANAVYNGLDPLLAVDIADAILYCITRPQHVNINDMLIMPTAQASATVTKRN
jgi:3-hydroxy acid dehydrogenase/malonic semialdehyde reductase